MMLLNLSKNTENCGIVKPDSVVLLKDVVCVPETLCGLRKWSCLSAKSLLDFVRGWFLMRI